jgi:citrate lyase subunit beta/citryl-CoA lyase
MGFGGKLLIHPAQIAPARQGFLPNKAEIDWARRVLEAAARGGAALSVDGAMVDAPVIARARQIIARAA